MSVDTRAHIESPVLQERAVLRRISMWGCAPYGKRKAISIKGHSGDDIRIALDDLGEALRILKVRPADLGYPAPTRKAKPCA
ncbi:MAG: hypothetical protein V4864_25930 [Pseudomonadota bacterium]